MVYPMGYICKLWVKDQTLQSLFNNHSSVSSKLPVTAFYPSLPSYTLCSLEFSQVSPKHLPQLPSSWIYHVLLLGHCKECHLCSDALHTSVRIPALIYVRDHIFLFQKYFGFLIAYKAERSSTTTQHPRAFTNSLVLSLLPPPFV